MKEEILKQLERENPSYTWIYGFGPFFTYYKDGIQFIKWIEV